MPLTKADLRALRILAAAEINRQLPWARIKQPDDSHLEAQRRVEEWEERLNRIDEEILT